MINITENAEERIYSQPIPTYKNGKPMWKRTGLYKASIASGRLAELAKGQQIEQKLEELAENWQKQKKVCKAY